MSQLQVKQEQIDPEKAVEKLKKVSNDLTKFIKKRQETHDRKELPNT